MKNEKNQQDIYGILRIAPTDDFTVVKKAYIKQALATHPDKNPGKSDEEFKVLQNAWEKINSEAKLRLYFELYQQNRVHEFDEKLSSNFSKSPFSFPAEKNGQANVIPSDALNEYRTDEIDIFIPVPFSPSIVPGLSNARVHLSLDPKEREINLENIRKFIINSNNGIYQVGVTYKEAVDIVNQHGHNSMSLIVRLRLPITRLSDARASEKELAAPNILNARSADKYFTLQPNTVIHKEDIYTVQPMSWKEYRNSVRFMHSLEKAGSHIGEIYSENPVAFYTKGQKPHVIENEKPSNSSHSITGFYIRDNIRAGWNWLFFSPSSPSSSSQTNPEEKKQSERGNYLLNNK
ncbi:chaperone protein DnaJ [Legionella gratiana]|uniref:Chaperone protein DnaJ n=1 Tax=Legionella gratiana TaxID=45066 RepID=A0A378J5R1_9GAMM|nr:DnaJ domain-containing protein [Legionella gratiana]KTD06212.1 chaperone protein DnaJ [Legionella gratiana]STX43092.1 chaperone protein DnaJ [Legionella gratiana]